MLRRWLVWGLVLVSAAALGAGAWHLWSVKRLQAELDLAQREMGAGTYGAARARLLRLETWWPGQGEIAFRLGLCEQALGRRERALDAWARVPSTSPYYARAAALAGNEFIESGHYTQAEAVLTAASGGPGAYDVGRALSRLYRLEGRTDDVRRVLRASWSQSPEPGTVLKELWLLDDAPPPLAPLEKALAAADRNDDRVWLGRANVAILRGQFDEAARWLDACQRRRPSDPAIWRARLELAQARGDVAALAVACAHLAADALGPAEVIALRVWVAERQGDHDAERRTLTAPDAQEPVQTALLERFAALAAEAGQPQEAARILRRKNALDGVQDRCRKLFAFTGERDLTAHAKELARLTGVLRRRFESRGWALLAERGPAARGPVGVDPLADESPESAAGPPAANVWAELRRAAASPPPAPPAAQPFGPEPRFINAAEAAHLDTFFFDNGQTPYRLLPETLSGGVALLDYDGDGWLDVYCVQGGPIDADPTSPRAGADRLFHNDHHGGFTDVTRRSGLASLARGYGLGVAVGDIDNDGDPDLFLTRLHGYLLLRNNGNGTFADITAAAGLAGARDLPTSAAFADLDADGDLDLYVCHCTLYDPAHPPLCRNAEGRYVYCDPTSVEPAPDHVFRNQGGRFIDVTREAGFTDPDGRGLGVVAADLDGDCQIDLFVTNAGTRNYLFHNNGHFAFEEVGHSSGVAISGAGGYQGGIGAACADLDGDGTPDLLVTNAYGEGAVLYQNLGARRFAEASTIAGLRTPTRYRLGLGIAAIDTNNNGYIDIMINNGNVHNNPLRAPYAMAAQLFTGDGRGRLRDVSAVAGDCWKVPRVGRGLAAGDLNNDGRIDAVIVAQNDPLAYFHNDTSAGHFVTFALRGTVSNRDAVGARLVVATGMRRQYAQRTGGGSYLSSSDHRLHFGLGAARRVDSVEVRWPSGKTQTYRNLKADSGYLLIEADDQARPLVGFPSAR